MDPHKSDSWSRVDYRDEFLKRKPYLFRKCVDKAVQVVVGGLVSLHYMLHSTIWMSFVCLTYSNAPLRNPTRYAASYDAAYASSRPWMNPSSRPASTPSMYPIYHH